MESKTKIFFIVFLQFFTKFSLSKPLRQIPNDDHSDAAWSKTKYEKITKKKLIESSVTLDCGKGWLNPGMKNATFYWTKNGSSKLRRPMHDTPVKFTENNSKLQLRGLISSDQAIYRCTGRYNGTTVRKEFNVTMKLHAVSQRPYLLWPAMEADGRGELGKPHTFHCRVYMAKTVVWKKMDPNGKNYTVIENGTRGFRVTGHVVKDDEDGVHRDEQKREHTMTIENVTTSSAGEYRCAGTNYLGTTFVKINFKVFEQQPPALDSSKEDSKSSYFWMGAILGVLFVIIMLNAGLWKRAKSNQQTLYPIRNADCIPQMERVDEPNAVRDLDLWQATTGFYGQSAVQVDQMPYDPNWEIKRSDIQLEKILDEGFFGQVYRAKVTQNVQYTNDVEEDTMYSKVCAVKMLKESRYKADMLSEFEQMKSVGSHVNIAGLIGICTSMHNTVWLLMEYAEEGNLKAFLRRNRPNLHRSSSSSCDDQQQQIRELTYRDLVSASHQIANGMNYLVQKKCVHRDLAARNVLVTREYAMKISDFGLARNVVSKDYYRKKTKGHLPYKWMALEALTENVFTHATDVWSFGVLLWEVFTLGNSPYPGLKTNDLVSYLRAGNRLKQPEYSTPLLHRLMKDCWDEAPSRRPSFRQLLEDFKLMLDSTSEDDRPLSNMLSVTSGARQRMESVQTTTIDLSDIPSPCTGSESYNGFEFGEDPGAAAESTALMQESNF